MDCALQLGRSNALMSYTVAADTVFNSMSEKLYSAEREVGTYIILFILYFVHLKITEYIIIYLHICLNCQFQSCTEEIRKLEDKFTKLLAESVNISKHEES